jgi:hypothetical protein
MILKKFSFFVLIVSFSVVMSGCSSTAQSNNQKNVPEIGNNGDASAVVYFFWGDGCPHCEDQKPFWKK